MDSELVKSLIEKYPNRTRWEYVNFVLEPYGEFTGRAILSQLRRLREIELQLPATDLAAERQQIEAWLATFSQGEITEHLDKIEENDSAYWVQRLGREAAVDMVTKGRISKEVLDKAILFDEANYRAFTETCNTIIKVVGDVTRDVEMQMGLMSPPQLPDGEPQ